MGYTVEGLLEEIKRRNKIIYDSQEELLCRRNTQQAMETELITLSEENKKLKNKLYWWQKL